MPGKVCVKRSETFSTSRDVKWEGDEDHNESEKTKRPMSATFDDEADLDEDQHSKSSYDETDNNGEDSPPMSRGKKMWNNFKMMRSRSRERKSTKKTKQEKREMEDNKTDLNACSDTGYDFDALFNEAETRQQKEIEEDGKNTSESIKNTSESLKNTSESIKNTSESLKNTSESIKNTSESLKNTSESIKNTSESIKKKDLEEPLQSDHTEIDHVDSTHKKVVRRKRSRSHNSFRLGKCERKRGKSSETSYSTVEEEQPLLKEYPFFHLDVILKHGSDLRAMDCGGSSDPYVKFKQDSKQLYRSRTIMKNVNPEWNEKTSFAIEDPYKIINVKVFDYDGISDDCIGVAELYPSTFVPNEQTEVKLILEPEKRSSKIRDIGYLTLQCILIPKTQEELEKYQEYNKREGKPKLQSWSNVVTVLLVSGHDLLPMDDSGFADPYVRFKLGEDKAKSKNKPCTLNPVWREQFDFRMFENQSNILEISVFDYDMCGRDDPMGNALIDLSDMKKDETLFIEKKLEGGEGFIKMYVTVSGSVGIDLSSDLNAYVPKSEYRKDIYKKYSIANTGKDMKDVGWLQVKIIKADSLPSADIGGKSDPFCVAEIVNTRVQTHTEYKTLTPNWGKIFHMPIKDVHANIEITVFDEDRDKKVEFLGKVIIPILRIHKGMRRWYVLKDKNVMCRKKGALLMEIDFEYNPIRAAIRTINPAEKKYMKPEVKFKMNVLKRNIDRLSKLGEQAAEGGKVLGDALQWENIPLSACMFIGALIGVWTFELHLIPFALALVLIGGMIVAQIRDRLLKGKDDDDYQDEINNEDDDEDKGSKDNKKKEEKTSFKEKINQINEICLQVQQGTDFAATIGERIKNIFNWTVPYLSWLALFGCSLGTVVLYFVPLRILILAFVTNKFTKCWRKGRYYKDNNEVMDFLSRVPSDKELIMYRELRPDGNLATTFKKKRNP